MIILYAEWSGQHSFRDCCIGLPISLSVRVSKYISTDRSIERIGRRVKDMTSKEIQELKYACSIANARTEEKIKARKKKQEKAQTIAFMLMLGLTTIYVGR